MHVFYEDTRDGFIVSTAPERLQLDVIHDFLSNRSYWAQGRPRALIARSLENSVCFGLYHGDRQIGLARVVTDLATFAFLVDVFVLETYRGRGLGKWLVRCVMACPALQDVRRWSLCTTDAHSLYQQVGFRALSSPEKHMEFLRYASYAERARTGAYTDDEAAMAEDENLGGCG